MTATNREPIKKKGGDDMENVKRIPSLCEAVCADGDLRCVG